ncbi:MAG: hypothetical protein KAU10_04485 [Dehalococcoidia bacterium]|nr:hypothetical protein [Dehalococcoidia bacterium]
MKFEYFQYEGESVLKRAGRVGSIEGLAAVSGQLGRQVTILPGHDPILGMVDFVSLSGVFTAKTTIPTDFAPSISSIKNAHTISLVGEGGIGPALPCTVERIEGERSLKIIHAGYSHHG